MPSAVPYDVSENGNVVRYGRRRFRDVSMKNQAFPTPFFLCLESVQVGIEVWVPYKLGKWLIIA